MEKKDAAFNAEDVESSNYSEQINIEPFKIKVKNAMQSRIVQEFMIANGWRWGGDGECVMQEIQPFLFFHPSKEIYYGLAENRFKDYPLPRLKYKEFLAKYIIPNKEINNTTSIEYKDYGIRDIIEAFKEYSTNNPTDFFRMPNGQVYSNRFILREMELGSKNGRDFVRQLIGATVQNIQNNFKPKP